MKADWRHHSNRSVSESIAALNGPALWDEEVERRLCRQAYREKQARGGKVLPWDRETSDAIARKRADVLRKQVRELIERETELQDLYRTSDSLIDWEKVAALCNEIDSLGITWAELETIGRDHRAKLHELGGQFKALALLWQLEGPKDSRLPRLFELEEQLRDVGVDWRKRAHLESLLEEFLYAQYTFTPEGGWDYVLEAVRDCLNSPYIQSLWLTHFILVRLIYFLMAPFQRIYEEVEATSGWESLWKSPIWFGWTVLMGIPVLVRWRLSWPFWVIWVLLAVWAFERLTDYFRSERMLRRLMPIYLEVERKMFDPEECARRLHSVEDSGLYVPSVIYTLLRLKQA